MIAEAPMLRVILLVLLVLALLGSLPLWSYSNGWGYYPVSGFGLLLIILLLFMFRGRSRVRALLNAVRLDWRVIPQNATRSPAVRRCAVSMRLAYADPPRDCLADLTRPVMR